MRIVIATADRDLEEAVRSIALPPDAAIECVSPGDAFERAADLASAAAILLAVDPAEEERLLQRVREAAPRPSRIVVRAAEAFAGCHDALAHGADEVVFADTLATPGLGAAELSRAIESARTRRALGKAEFGVGGEEAELLRAVFDNDLLALSLNELGGAYVAVNDLWLKETGYRREEVLGRTPAELGLWKDLALVQQIFRELREKGRAQSDAVTVRTRDGAERTFRIGLALVEFRGRPHVVAFARDVSEERRLAREFLQAQKMEAVGRLAAGVAHDFNNLLTVIQMATFFARRADGDPMALADCLEEIEQTGRRGATLVRQLLAFARREKATPRLIALDELVRDLEKLIRRVIGEDVELVTRLGSGPARVFVDPGQIEQILLNLAINARDAMPAGGRLTVETRVVSAGPREDASAGPPARYVSLLVRDTGGGMSDEVQAQLFEPFFTTKPIGEGTGLGLASVSRIVSESGGRIVVESALGKGATFDVLFPLHVGEDPMLEVDAAEDVRGGSEHVLVVEDEDGLRSRIRAVLEAHGYDVREAADGMAALQDVVSVGHAPDLVISDVRMPRMSGPDAVGHMRDRFGDVPAVYLSGYDEPDLETGHGGCGRRSLVLRKPFSPEALLRAAREMLDARGGDPKLTSPVSPRRTKGDGCRAGGDSPGAGAPGARRRDRREAPDPG